jgi:hypothetical protein
VRLAEVPARRAISESVSNDSKWLRRHFRVACGQGPRAALCSLIYSIVMLFYPIGRQEERVRSTARFTDQGAEATCADYSEAVRWTRGRVPFVATTPRLQPCPNGINRTSYGGGDGRDDGE